MFLATNDVAMLAKRAVSLNPSPDWKSLTDNSITTLILRCISSGEIKYFPFLSFFPEQLILLLSGTPISNQFVCFLNTFCFGSFDALELLCQTT